MCQQGHRLSETNKQTNKNNRNVGDGMLRRGLSDFRSICDLKNKVFR